MHRFQLWRRPKPNKYSVAEQHQRTIQDDDYEQQQQRMTSYKIDYESERWKIPVQEEVDKQGNADRLKLEHYAKQLELEKSALPASLKMQLDYEREISRLRYRGAAIHTEMPEIEYEPRLEIPTNPFADPEDGKEENHENRLAERTRMPQGVLVRKDESSAIVNRPWTWSLAKSAHFWQSVNRALGQTRLSQERRNHRPRSSKLITS